MEIRPQPGPQEQACACSADILIFGGEAGGGKTFAALLESLRHVANKLYRAIFFRRTSPQLTGAGSVWEKANELYRPFGAHMRESPTHDAEFPSGAVVSFQHLQYAKTVHDHQGKEYALIIFEELTHFLAEQFWYFLSRLRSTSTVRPYIRATTNPDPDSFVRKLIAWWIGKPDCKECQDGSCRKVDHGYANPARSGVLRWFIRRGDTMIWGDTRDELLPLCHGDESPISITFIHSSLSDNPALTSRDPGYAGRVAAMGEVESERLGKGNWNVRPAGGKYIQEAWFSDRYTHLPQGTVYIASDYAVTEPEDGDEPDYTEHGVFLLGADGKSRVIDWWCGQTESDEWIEKLLDLAKEHRPAIYFGEAGVIQKAIEPYLKQRMLKRKIFLNCEWLPSIVDKATRGRTFQAMAKLGLVQFGHQPFVQRVIDQCVAFPGARFDDAFDTLSLYCRALEENVHIDHNTTTKNRTRDGYQAEKKPARSWRAI